MKCKVCGKELIGKEKLFCKSCWTIGIDMGKQGAMVVGGIVLSILAIVANRRKD